MLQLFLLAHVKNQLDLSLTHLGILYILIWTQADIGWTLFIF